MQLELLREWAELVPNECFQRGNEYAILTARESWIIIREGSSSIQWEGVFFAILAFCKQRGWEVEISQKDSFFEAKICELTEQYSCVSKFSQSSIIEALLSAYVQFLSVKDDLDKPELIGNGNSQH